jgi:molecular chaperone HtpG
MVVLSRHLYSTPRVAVRELVQNAHDSIVRRRVFDPAFSGGLIRVDVIDDRLFITDDGFGMTEADIHDSLGAVGRGVTGATRAAGDEHGLIGQFGVGFLSAFVLGSRVTVHTRSYEAPGVCHTYDSNDAITYRVERCDGACSIVHEIGAVGTRVEVELDGDGSELTDLGVLGAVLRRYCVLLRVPLYLQGERIDIDPPWRTPFDDPSLARSQSLSFAARFEQGVEPLCVVDVAPIATSDVHGQLWVQDSASYATSDNRNLSVFVRGMLLDGDARTLLPTWAGFIGGVVESDGLVPTASREDIQRTPHYEDAKTSLSDQLIAGLAVVASTEPETWRRVVRRHGQALLGAAIADDRVFDLIADVVTVPTSEGDLRPAELAQRSRGEIHLSHSANGGFEEIVCRCLHTPVARGLRFGVTPFLRRWCRLNGVSLVELGTDVGNREFLHPADLDPAATAWLQAGLASAGESIAAARFEPTCLPLLLIPDREAEVRQRLSDDEADRRISSAALRLARSHAASLSTHAPVRLYVNLASPVVRELLDAFERGLGGADDALRVLRNLKALLGTAGPAQPHDELVSALEGLGAVAMQLVQRGA